MERCVKTLQGDYSSFSGLFPESGDLEKQTGAIFLVFLGCHLKGLFFFAHIFYMTF